MIALPIHVLREYVAIALVLHFKLASAHRAVDIGNVSFDKCFSTRLAAAFRIFPATPKEAGPDRRNGKDTAPQER